MPSVRSKGLSFAPYQTEVPVEFGSSAAVHYLGFVLSQAPDVGGQGTPSTPSIHQLAQLIGRPLFTWPVSSANGLRSEAAPHFPDSQAYFLLVICFSSLIKLTLNYPSEATVI